MLDVNGDETAIANRIATIREQLPSATDAYTSEKLMDRLAKLSGKVAVLYVGATTDTELREKKARIDDALRATRSAVAKGYIIGGGTMLATLGHKLDTNDLITQVYSESLKEPLRVIAQNAGVSPDLVEDRVFNSDSNTFGYNAATDTYEDLVKAGVIDPALVVMEALRAANSAATMILLSDCVLYSDTITTAELADHDY